MYLGLYIKNKKSKMSSSIIENRTLYGPEKCENCPLDICFHKDWIYYKVKGTDQFNL